MLLGPPPTQSYVHSVLNAFSSTIQCCVLQNSKLNNVSQAKSFSSKALVHHFHTPSSVSSLKHETNLTGKSMQLQHTRFQTTPTTGHSYFRLHLLKGCKLYFGAFEHTGVVCSLKAPILFYL